MIIFIAISGLLTACSTYKASLTLRPIQTDGLAESRALGESETRIAQEVAARLAELNEMSVVPGPYDPRFTEPYRVLSMFRGHGRMRHVVLSTAIKSDRSEIAFAITDQEHGSETEFTSTLWRELKSQILEHMSGYAVLEEKSSIPRNLLAP